MYLLMMAMAIFFCGGERGETLPNNVAPPPNNASPKIVAWGYDSGDQKVYLPFLKKK